MNEPVYHFLHFFWKIVLKRILCRLFKRHIGAAN